MSAPFYDDARDGECDPSFVASYLKDQQLIYAGGYKHTCEDCKRPNTITDEMKRRGYCCDRCARNKELGIDGD